MASILLENVSVDFPIYGTQRSLRKALFERSTGGLIRHEGRKQNRVVIQALQSVNLDLRRGDRLGLVGHNGAGKSTLLKVMAGVYRPTLGRITVRGKVTPLFGPFPGLDGDDSAYENIVTCGLFLGMTRSEIARKLPDIEEFSELGEYLSLPVRTYSAGMATRFGFALATAIDPEVLLLDEGLATGDLRFAERAAKRIEQFIQRSSILVLASHSEAMIRAMCTKSALMHSGRVLKVGATEEILDDYHRLVSTGSIDIDLKVDNGRVTEPTVAAR